jgi:hypothetical protein
MPRKDSDSGKVGDRYTKFTDLFPGFTHLEIAFIESVSCDWNDG